MGAARTGYESGPHFPYDGSVILDSIDSPETHVAVLLDDDHWIAVTDAPLDPGAIESWVRRPSCGAVVTFVGTARDHSEGRPGVIELVYEAYEGYVVAKLREIVDEARRRWPSIERVAVVHRTGTVRVGDDAVVVALASPHRDDAFPAAAFIIDTAKATAPIWKLERWDGGESWGLACGCVTPTEHRS